MLLFLPPAPVCWPKQLLCHQLAYPNSNQWWQPLATLIQTLPLTVYLVQNVSVHKQKARIQCSSKSQKNMEDPLEFQFSCCLLQFAINWSKYAQCNVVWQGKECFSEQTRKTGIQCSRKSRKYGRCTWISVQSLPLGCSFLSTAPSKQFLLLSNHCVILHIWFLDHTTHFASCHWNKPTPPRPQEPIDTHQMPSEEDISCCLG